MSRQLFYKWLKRNTNLQETTIKSYTSAIQSISNFAISERLLEVELYNPSKSSELIGYINVLEQNELFKIKNQDSNRRWSSAIEKYKEFIMDENDDYINVGTDYLHKDFQDWLSIQIKSDGENYSEHTQRGYVYSLEKACKDFKNKYIKDINIFTIGSYNEFKKIEKIIRKDEEFQMINQKYGKGQLSAGLIKYKEFLKTISRPVKRSESITNEIYNKEIFLKDVFINEQQYETIKSLLIRKKNIILQGAPGVGKTYAAKRIAYSLMGEKDDTKIKVLQFHQSYSYEDFIMGYRPNGVGFDLKKGPFYQFCQLASNNSGEDYFLIIDEINRGNMSKIFGELMMLIEGDKRGEEIELTYSEEPFKVPPNLFIIGTMNTADRSLAIIDYALRRRFTFIDLEPAFNTKAFENHLLSQGANINLINKIKTRIESLNTEIEKDVNLGKGFRIGHSYFCNYYDSSEWYYEIIKYEIYPLIKEYWFDEEEKVESYKKELIR